MKWLPFLLLLAAVGSRNLYAQEKEDFYDHGAAAPGHEFEDVPDTAIGAVISRYERNWDDVRRKVAPLPPAEKQAVLDKEWAPVDKAVAEILEKLKADPSDAAAGHAMGWIAMRWHDSRQLVDLVPLVVPGLTKSPHIGAFCLFLDAPAGQEQIVTDFLQLIIKESPHKDVLGAALYAYAARLRKSKDPASAKLRLEMLEKIAADHKGLVVAGNHIGDRAAGQLFAQKYLTPGSPAPPLTGRALGGGTASLSDHAGKVVLVVFWGDWSEKCRRVYEWLDRLTRRLSGKPFAVLGINTDAADQATAVEAKLAGWKSIADGSPQGPVTLQWHVTSLPAFFIIGQAGKMRFTGLTSTRTLEAAIDQLLAEGAKKKK